jgi:endoglucanase
MRHSSRPRTLIAAVAASLVALGLAAQPAVAANDVLDPSAELWLNPYSTTLEAAQSLTGDARDDALLLGSVPQATWINGGTPAEAMADVDAVVTAADAVGQVPVLVAYNIPFRDCAQYSAGGATTQGEYEAWIDAFAAGIGDREAVVILEPDGLGIIPHYTTVDGVQEWCQPAEADPATAAAERFEMLNHAVDAFAMLPATATYLDGTHTGWLNVGDISDRLIKAGVADADGFFLNASNYEFTTNLEYYGSWISSCITLVTELGGGFGDCGNQYWAGGPANNWGGDWPAGFGGALSTYGVWSEDAAEPALNVAGIESRYAAALGETEPTTHFVIDTSRNGNGPWDGGEDVADWPDPQLWCNPLDRAIGPQPTTETGSDLVDAYLWIKIPGESDGECYRGTGGPQDPARGYEAPAAGVWFPQMAAELLDAEPGLPEQQCSVEYIVHGTWPGGFNTQIWIRNTGDEPIRGWQLSWTFAGDQTIDHGWSADYEQDGAVVTAENLKWNATLKPGGRTTIGFIGDAPGQVLEPWLFELDGEPCTTP